jgi:predicted MFS family arabinose efflux permease
MTSRPARGLYPYYVLFALGVVNMFNYIDRHIVSVLLVPIQNDFGVSDEWMGLLTGLAFMLAHSLFAIPIARWADHSSRRNVIALGVAVWSAMTALSGLARNFGQLVALRMGVGIGEAAGAPPAHSIISDYFEPARRATALALFSVGLYVGIMFGYIAAGWIGEHFGWRRTFLMVGLPGLALALLVRLTVREPPRGTAVESHGFVEVLRYLLTKPAYAALLAAASAHAFASYGAAHWAPTFLRRVHGMSLSEMATWLGIVSGLGGALGSLAGGMLADRLGRRDPRWYPRVAAGAAFASIPFAALFLMSETRQASLAAYLPYILLVGAYNGPLFALNQSLARPRMRAMAAAIHLITVSLIGGGLGPWLVGRMNDALRPEYGDAGIRYSLLGVIALGSVLAGLLYLATGITLRRDLAAARQAEAA